MSSTSHLLDVDRVKKLFDLRGSFLDLMGGSYHEDPYPVWKKLREQAPVHEGTLHDLSDFHGQYFFHGLPFEDRPHFTAFSFEACDTAYRNNDLFSSAGWDVDFSQPPSALNSMLAMGGERHKRYRALVQPSFVPANATWWIQNWIEETVQALIDSFINNGRAELNVDFCAAIPVLTITGSFGIPVERALDVRELGYNSGGILDIIAPIVKDRRENPTDDLISVLVQAEMTDKDGQLHRLSDEEVNSFALLLLTAGSGTTWKQMGIVLTTLLQRPEVLKAVKEDRDLLRPVIDEIMRWMPTDPMFSRWLTDDTELGGVHLPKGSVLHLNLGAANRDPARWDNPEEFDFTRKAKSSFGFGGGAHTCMGMHVARAEMITGISAILDRLPNVRLDPDAEAPKIIGFYERGATAIPVVFD